MIEGKNYYEIEPRKIGRGAQHVVGRLRDRKNRSGQSSEGRLIKYPHWTGRRWDVSTPATVQKDLAIHRAYSTPIPETSVVIEPTIDDGHSIVKPPYAILVEEIHGRTLREADLEDPAIREQFAELTRRSLDIRSQNDSGVDFMGFESIKHLIDHLRGKLPADELGACNILIDSREQIKLIDTSLLTPARAPFGVGWAIDFLIDVQHSLMAEVLQDQQLIDKSASENHSRVMTRLAEKIYRLSRGTADTPRLAAARRSQNIFTAAHDLPLHHLYPGVQ
jgi:hypothetical protein